MRICRTCLQINPLPDLHPEFGKSLSSRKYLYSPHRRNWNFLEGGGFCEAKKFKEMYEASLKNFTRWVGGGGGGFRKNPFCKGGMDVYWSYTVLEKKNLERNQNKVNLCKFMK